MKFPTGRYNPFRLLLKQIVKISTKKYSRCFSDQKIDILIPVISKDIDCLQYVIECARQNLINPIDSIYIVGKGEKVKEFCLAKELIFIDEDFALPIKKKDIRYNGQEWHRSGWLFQQMIKLNADKIIKNENVLILDADTCLISKQTFVLKDKTFILNFSDEYHKPYTNFVEKVTGKRRFYFSFIAHHMLFNKYVLCKLKNQIENVYQENWIEAILKNIDYNQPSCFSEYELYGNFLYHNYKKLTHLEYWYNKSISNLCAIEEKYLKSRSGQAPIKSDNFTKVNK